MRRRLLLGLVAAPAAIALLGGAALASPRLRALIKSSRLMVVLNTAALRQFDSWVYNATHEVPSAKQLGDGQPPERIRLSDPMGLALDAKGTLYVADRGLFGPGHVVWALSGGVARVVAGTGARGVPATDVPATRAALGSPQSLAVDSLGRVYIADSYNHVVLRLEQDGRLVRFAGSGDAGFAGDGGHAKQASLNQPYDIRIDRDGNVYIADFGNHRIRKVNRAGIIETVAGTGEPGYAGDGGPAALARLNGPYGICVDPGYGLLIADSGNHVVRAVGPDGTIWTVAGTGEPGNSGDGGPAWTARFNSPQTLAIDTAGNIYVGDEHNHAVRMIDATGTVHRVVGTGVPGFSADSTPATAAQLNDPESIIVLPDGTMLFTEAGNHRLRLLDGTRRLRTVAGAPSRGS